jgi:rhodanese-related sulfurtransferase
VEEQEFATKFNQVDQILPQDLAAMLKLPDELLVLDVREDAEYAVGTITGAIRIVPGIEIDALMRQIGPRVIGKTVVAICSIGYRSSVLANRVQSTLLARGAVRVANLRGGVFAWHNYGRPLVDQLGHTNYVHPYSRSWKSYLEFDHLARMSPRKSPVD